MSSNKKIIVETMKMLYNKKFISPRDGNISFKPKNKNYFYISAGSVKKKDLNEDQIIKVDFDINFENKFNHILKYNKDYKYLPSREIHMHSFLQTHPYYYNKNTYIVHAHPPNITSYIGIKNSFELNNIKNTFPEINVGNIGKNVMYHDAGSNNLAMYAFINLLKNDIVGLERHGTLSIGDDIDKIIEDIETLEYYIDIELKAKI